MASGSPVSGSPDEGFFAHPGDLHPCRTFHLSPFVMSWALPQALGYYGDSVALGITAGRRSRGCRSGPLHVEGLRSSLAPAHCRVCPVGRSRRRSADPRETGIRVSASFPEVTERTHWDWSSSNPALPMRGLTRERLSTLLTLGLTPLHPHAIVPSLLSDEGKRIVFPPFFQRGRDAPDKTRQPLATAHLPGRTHLRSFASRCKVRRSHRPKHSSRQPVRGQKTPAPNRFGTWKR